VRLRRLSWRYQVGRDERDRVMKNYEVLDYLTSEGFGIKSS